MPVQSKNLHGESSKPNAEEFAHFLGDIFASEVGFNSDELRALLEETSANGLSDIKPFTNVELQVVLKKCDETNALIPVVWWLNVLFTAIWICTSVSWMCSIICLPLDALTRVGVTLSLLCCLKAVFCFRPTTCAQLRY